MTNKIKVISLCAVIISFLNVFGFFLGLCFLLAQAGYKGNYFYSLVFIWPIWLGIVFSKKNVAVRRSWHLSLITSAMWPAIIVAAFISNKAALADLFSTRLFFQETNDWLAFGAILIVAVFSSIVVGRSLIRQFQCQQIESNAER